MQDRIKTDLHRFKPNSRICLDNEQLYQLKQLHFMEHMNRHRGVNQ